MKRFIFIIALILTTGTVFAANNILIDGDSSDWENVSVYAPLYQAGDQNKPVLGHVKLWYNCDFETLYTGVFSDYMLDPSPEENFVKLNGRAIVNGYNVPANNIPPDFAWFTNSGWEASAPVVAGMYDFQAHINVNIDGNLETATVLNHGISIELGCPTGIALKDFSGTNQQVPMGFMITALLLGAGTAYWILKRK